MDRPGTLELRLLTLAAGAFAAASCGRAPPAAETTAAISAPPPAPPPPPPWSGVKAVADTLSAKAADAAAPIVLGEGMGRAIYVQWGDGGTTYLTRFNSNGTSQKLSRKKGGKGGHGVAVPPCLYKGVTQDCPMLPVDTKFASSDDTYPSAPEVIVMDCGSMELLTSGGGTTEFSAGSTLGALIPAGGTRMFLAAKYNPWVGNMPKTAGPDNQLLVTPTRVNACAFHDAEDELYMGSPGNVLDDGYSKGRLLSLGLPATFTVTAAARLGADAMLVAGTRGNTGKPWVVSVDASFALAHQSDVPIGGGLFATTTGSVAVDAGGSVYVCGTSRSLLAQVGKPAPFQGWIAQGAADLTGWQVLSLPEVAVQGCAVTAQGSVVVSGSYSGTFNGQTSNGGSDLFVALVTPGMGGAAPTLASFTHQGSSAGEIDASAPLVISNGDLYVAGITQGNWGAATGPSPRKVFVARFDPVTLALK